MLTFAFEPLGRTRDFLRQAELPAESRLWNGTENTKNTGITRRTAYTACVFDNHLYLTPLGQARQFIETCGT